jgi:tetratricopeptide (TPR) repeat protein
MLIDVARWDDAERELAAALADPGAGAEPWCFLAQIHLARGWTKDARLAAERAVSLDPDVEWAHRLMAIALLDEGRTKAAERAARRAAVLAPDSVDTLHVLAEVLHARGSRREARELSAHNIAVNPQEPRAWESAARMAAEASDWPEAQAHARRGLSLAPEDEDLLLLLSRALADQGMEREAAAYAVSAIRAKPTGSRGRAQLEVLGSAGPGLPAIWLVPLIAVLIVRAMVPSRFEAALLLAGAAYAAVIVLLEVVLARRRLARLDPVAVKAARQRLIRRGRIVLICCGLILVFLITPIFVVTGESVMATFACVCGVLGLAVLWRAPSRGA